MKHMKRWRAWSTRWLAGRSSGGQARLGYGIAWTGLSLLTATLWLEALAQWANGRDPASYH